MWWTAMAMAASPVIFGEARFRAPDGISDAEVLADGTLWTLSDRGEMAHLSTDGKVLDVFQACSNRAHRTTFTLAADGRSMALACGDGIEVLSLPDGRTTTKIRVVPTDAALSADGATLAVVGELQEGAMSSALSYVLIYDARSGALLHKVEGEWDSVEATRYGWAMLRNNDEELVLGGLVPSAGGLMPWTWTGSRSYASDELSAAERLAVRDNGQAVCVRFGRGGACFAPNSGKPLREWQQLDAPFSAPGAIGRAQSPDGRIRYAVTSTLVLPEKDLLNRDLPWAEPRQIVANDAATVFAVLDERGKVFVGSGKNWAEQASSPGPIALSPDGTQLWYRTRGRSMLVELASRSTRPMPDWSAAGFAEDGSIWGVPDGRAVLQSMARGGSNLNPELPVKGLTTVSGLQVEDRTVLLLASNDDHWLNVSRTTGKVLDEADHLFSPYADIRSVKGTLHHTVLTPQGQALQIGTRKLTVTDRARVRVLGTGHWAEAMPDSNQVVIHDPGAGPPVTHTLPSRVAEAWSSERALLLGLRDGRIAVITVP